VKVMSGRFAQFAWFVRDSMRIDH